MKTIALLAVAAACVGCVNFDKPLVPPPPRTAAQTNFDAVWDASLGVLRDYRFAVAVQNRREGTIATAPLTGKYFTEFWRKDATLAADVLESTVQNLYKTATVSIRPVAGRSDEFAASVAVEVWRSQKSALLITSTSEAYGLFTMTGGRSRWLTDFGRGKEEEQQAEERSGAAALRPLEGSAATRGAASASWRTPLGRDAALEQEMTAEIAAAAGKRLRTAPVPATAAAAAAQVTP